MALASIYSSFCCANDTVDPNDPSSQAERSEKGSEDTGSSRTYSGSPPLPNLTKPIDGFPAEQQNFLLAYPQYVSPVLDNIRETEYRRLEKLVYLDYTGASLYPESLVKISSEHLTSNVFGNPHSSNPP
jgi:molybdenum cofactor sulfurtransferase